MSERAALRASDVTLGRGSPLLLSERRRDTCAAGGTLSGRQPSPTSPKVAFICTGH